MPSSVILPYKTNNNKYNLIFTNSYNAALTYLTTVLKQVKGSANYSKSFGFGQQGKFYSNLSF
jgi:hypothetical protein